MSNTNVKKFIMDGADFPIVDEEARADIVDINNSLTHKLDWTTHNDRTSFTRGTEYNLPTNWNELWITVDTDTTGTNIYQFYIVRFASNNSRNYVQGYTLSANLTFVQLAINTNSNTIKVADIRNNGIQLSSTYVSVLYR